MALALHGIPPQALDSIPDIPALLFDGALLEPLVAEHAPLAALRHESDTSGGHDTRAHQPTAGWFPLRVTDRDRLHNPHNKTGNPWADEM